ncbi:MAG: glutathione S-transferase family protein [Rhizobiaceae bacterium]
MILIGQYDSPFVRRTAIAMRLYGIAFEHRPWSTFGDAEKIRPYNPLLRVPTLVLDGGDVLIESLAILDYLDGQMPAAERMFPQEEPARQRALKLASLAAGISDKAVALYYEQNLHGEGAISALWVERCRSQIKGALAALEKERAAAGSDYLFGGRIGHADVTIACMLRHLREAHPEFTPLKGLPALKDHAERMEALPVFQEIQQPFIPPKG